MNILTDLRARIGRALQARRIYEALDLLRTMASTVAAHWDVTNEISRIDDAYSFMSRYALDGADDPHREDVYAEIVRDITSLADSMVRDARSHSTSTLYFDAVRFGALHPESAARPVTERLRDVCGKISLSSFSGHVDPALTASRERLEDDLFKAVWTAFPLSRDAFHLLSDYLSDQTTPRHIKLLLISAILLGQLEYPDERRIMLLADLYTTHAGSMHSETGMRALVALVIALWCARGVKFSRPLAARLAAVAELPSWDSDVKMVSLLLLRTRDTEKITRTVAEEVIPSMLKLRPDIYRKLSDTEDIGTDPFDTENPEWEELLERSGLNKKLEKLNELQEQGGDVMMATFSHLKSFPFFSQISNWFMPFHDDHSAVMSTRDLSGVSLADMVAASDFVCSSDRFSMLFAVGSIPEAQRRMMMRQFEEQNIDMARMHAEGLSPEKERRTLLANNYVRDLYRFFKLFRRKGEFTDIFSGEFNPLAAPLLRESLVRSDSVELIAEFFFSHGYWEDAISAFDLLAEKEGRSAQLFQKIGFARQKLGNLAEALRDYEHAEMLDPSNRWTWRRIASCLRLLEQPAKALPYYRRLSEAQPDDLSVTLQLANTLAEAGQYAEAQKLYFKVEFLDPGSRKAIRPIAWTAFLSGDFDTARRYLDRVMADNPTPADILNLGHLEMATGHFHEAIDVYRRVIESPAGGRNFFVQSMRDDLRHLRAAGVDDLLTGIVIDRLLHS